jgi:hypothetical protein
MVLRIDLRHARDPEIRALWLDTAKYVPTEAGFWIVHDRVRTCIVLTRGGAIGCELRATLLKEGVALGVVTLGPPPQRAPREFLVAGLVPDEVRAVELRVGRKRRTIGVRDNAYSLRAPVPITVEHVRSRGS